MSIGSSIIAVVKRHFLSGLLVVVPLILTYLVLRFLFETVDGILQPLLFRLVGYSVPGLGVLTTLLLIIIAGFLTRNFIGRQLVKSGDRMLARMPIIRPIYSSAKQLMEAMTGPGVGSFKEVVLVQYPRLGAYSLAFVSNRVKVETAGGSREHVLLFVPSTPTPISGMVIAVPPEDVIALDMTVEEGVKFLMSGGVVSPDPIKRRTPDLLDKSGEVVNEAR